MQTTLSFFLPYVILAYGLGALISFLYGTYQTSIRKNPYGLTPSLILYGIFVWGDAVLIGAFWAAVSLFSFATQNVGFFMFAQSIFWMVRSAGEVIYWLLQQFAETKRDTPESLRFHTFFPGESIWFAYQVMWQLVFVGASLSLVYLIGLAY